MTVTTTFDKLSAAGGAKKVAAVGKKMTTGQALAGPFTALYVVAFIAAVAASYMLEGTNPWQSFTYQPGPWCELERTHNFMRTSTSTSFATLRSLPPPPPFVFVLWAHGPWGGGVGEPVNAWSDFSFLAVGFFMIYCGVHNMLWPVQNSKGEKTVNPMVSYPIVSIVWGGTACPWPLVLWTRLTRRARVY